MSPSLPANSYYIHLTTTFNSKNSKARNSYFDWFWWPACCNDNCEFLKIFKAINAVKQFQNTGKRCIYPSLYILIFGSPRLSWIVPKCGPGKWLCWSELNIFLGAPSAGFSLNKLCYRLPAYLTYGNQNDSAFYTILHSYIAQPILLYRWHTYGHHKKV